MSLNLAIGATAVSLSQNHFAAQIDPSPAHESLGLIAHPLEAVALNPQPLPPRELGLSSLLNRLDAVALNPQPLPPREALSLADRLGKAADEQCGTPRWLHHLPPPPPQFDAV